MKPRWYLAAFPVALLSCSGQGDLYGPPAAYGGATGKQTGGYANAGGSQAAAVGGIDAGSPTSSNPSGSMSVRYGPISSQSSGGTTS
jgi:hypothetical protein